MMTKYRRSYIPPVFHLEKAGEDQKRSMEIVFRTLSKSGISFAVVYKHEKKADALYIKSYGYFTLDEKGEIVKEVVDMYIDGDEINEISME